MKKDILTQIRYNRFNENYITIPIFQLKQMKYLCEWNIEENIKIEEIKKDFTRKKQIYEYILNIIKKHTKRIDSIVISKDNALYKELFAVARKIIDAEMIDNSYQIALIEENAKMIEQIYKLKKTIEDFKEGKTKDEKLIILVGLHIYHCDISLEYGQDVADYIWENDSLEDYYKKQNGILAHEEDKHVFLYENGKIEEVDLPKPTLKKRKTRTIN